MNVISRGVIRSIVTVNAFWHLYE